MATATARTEQPIAARRIAASLDRLRGLIRLYVGLEGLALAVTYLAVWFWMLLAVDYGVFRLFALDWVEELPRGVRAWTLGVVAVGLLVLLVAKLGVRVVRALRPDALALVLERRFHDDLGDRLITAVELGAPGAPDGYSPAMFEETVREASERAGRLPVHAALDWRWLRRRWLWAIGLAIGPYLVAGAVAWAYGSAPAGFARDFNRVATIWFERNVLLRDTLWPRQALLELLNEPLQEGDEMRVGRDAPPPALRVRAWKWVVADPDVSGGWRPLRWDDLSDEMLGHDPERDVVPAAWRHWPVDRVEQGLERPAPRRGLRPEAARQVLTELHERAASPELWRRLRELTVPQEVTVHYRGEATKSEQTMQRQAGNEYAGAAEVKESVQFTVQGEDFYTPWKRIIVVPPPVLVELALEEAQPAYLYHRVPRGGAAGDLAGRRQRFPGRPVTLTGDTSRIDVPAGTDVTLTAKADKPLHRPLGVTLAPPRKGAAVPQVPVAQPDEHTFRVRFERVREPLDFVFAYLDTDGVEGRRHVVIRPVDDLPPEVDVQIEVLRRTNQGYLATPLARVPFSGKVRDDHGLDKIDYAYAVTRLTGSESGASPVAPASAAGGAAGGLPAGFGGLPLLAPGAAPADQEQPTRTVPVAGFEQVLRDRARRDLAPEDLAAALEKPPGETPPREFTLDPEQEALDLAPLGLKVGDEKAAQQHYRLRLWVTATDNDVESGPHTGESKEKFTVVVVSENELLAEIAKEEEGLRLKLEDAVGRLKDGRIKVNKLTQDLPDTKPDEMGPLARRSEEVGEGLTRSWDGTRDVYNDYRRILKELQINRVQSGMVAKVGEKICEPLEGALNLEFVQADEAAHALQKALEAKDHDARPAAEVRQQLDRLITRLTSVLDAMAEVTSVNRLIETLMRIEKAEREEYNRLERLKKQRSEDVLDKLGGPEKP